jgi:protein-S-isoprenylcysteine O-methyltransferase Ste14
MEAKLLLIPWMASVLYSSVPLFWFVVHPFARSWRRMDQSPYRAVLPIWAALIFLLGWITWPWHAERLYSSPWMWLPAALLLLFGLSIYARIGSSFGAHKLSGEAEIRPDEHAQELVTTGLHARMRHPIYIAHLANFAGWTIGSGLAVAYVLLGISALVTFPLMIWLEERELAVRFGAPYLEYRQRVPLLPGFIFRHHEKRTA